MSKVKGRRVESDLLWAWQHADGSLSRIGKYVIVTDSRKHAREVKHRSRTVTRVVRVRVTVEVVE